MGEAALKMAPQPLIEGFKGLASYLKDRTGFDISEEAARRYCYRQVDPIPMISFNGRKGFEPEAVEEWIKRNYFVSGVRMQ